MGNNSSIQRAKTKANFKGHCQKAREAGALPRDNFCMKTTTIDRKHRMTLPESICAALGLKSNDRVEWRVEDGEIRGRRLAVQKPREPFPRENLRKYITEQRDKDQLAILASCVQGPVEAK